MNCDVEFAPKRREQLFCAERCRQIAEIVRYARRKMSDSTFARADINEAIESRIGVLVRGFYDKRGERFVASKQREQLRATGRCRRCNCDFEPDGERRFTVQHVSDGSGFQLEAWCYRCNMDQALSLQRQLSVEEFVFVAQCIERIMSLQPLRPCDGDSWQISWREHVLPSKKREIVVRPDDGRPKAWRSDRPYPGWELQT